MKAMWDRQTKYVWIKHDDGKTEQLGTAKSEVEAYDMVALAGFARYSNFLLSIAGSPFRELEVYPNETDAATRRS